MSEPNSSSDQIPPVPPAPSFTYGSDQPAAPEAPAAAEAPAVPAADPQLPPPAYGERLPGYQPTAAPAAPPAPAYAVPGYAAPGYGYVQSTGPRRRTWDVVLTIILFVLGLFGTIIGLAYAAILSDPYLFADAMAQQGMPIAVDTRGAALIIGISHPVLFLVSVGIGILLLVKRKIAFWVPLTAGVLAAIVFWGTLVAVVLSDPSFLDYVR